MAWSVPTDPLVEALACGTAEDEAAAEEEAEEGAWLDKAEGGAWLGGTGEVMWSSAADTVDASFATLWDAIGGGGDAADAVEDFAPPAECDCSAACPDFAEAAGIAAVALD